MFWLLFIKETLPMLGKQCGIHNLQTASKFKNSKSKSKAAHSRTSAGETFSLYCHYFTQSQSAAQWVDQAAFQSGFLQ